MRGVIPSIRLKVGTLNVITFRTGVELLASKKVVHVNVRVHVYMCMRMWVGYKCKYFIF